MECYSPIWIRKELHPKGGMHVPCGKCLHCLQTKRSVWTYRILQELKVAETARFVTLTYDEKYLPYVAQINNGVYETDTLWNLKKLDYKLIEPTLQRKDLTNFIKRLRSEILKDQKTQSRS